MNTYIAIFIASFYGIIIRFLFGFYSDFTEILSISLVFIVPLFIGFLTVALMGLEKVKDGRSAFFWPWLTTFILLVVTIFFNLEGTICWIIIFSPFAIMAGFGGLIAFYGLKKKNQTPDQNQTDDPDRFDRLKMSPLLTLPLFLGMLENDRLFEPATYVITREITINAAPAQVWSTIISVPERSTQDNPGFFSRLLQLPRHVRTTVDTAALGGRRIAYFERGLYFEETITEYVPKHTMTVAIKADPGNVPPTVLDEHIVIGGKHFKALNDTYLLTPLSNGQTKVQLSGSILLNTPFNWYAGLWAKWVLGDIFESLLFHIKTNVNKAQ